MTIRKMITPIMVLGMALSVGCGGGLALTQDAVDSAQKIYYAPLMMNRYIVCPVYRIPGDDEVYTGLSAVGVAAKKREVQKGVAENYAAVDMWANFAVGDTGRVGKDLVIIVGVIPEAAVNYYNVTMLANLREVLGDKVQPWPEGQFMREKMDIMGNLYDFKNSDADMFIRTTPPSSKRPVMIRVPNDFKELPKANQFDYSTYNHTLTSSGNTNNIALFMRNPENGKMQKAVSLGFAVFIGDEHLTYVLRTSREESELKRKLTKAYAQIPEPTLAAAIELATQKVNTFEELSKYNIERFFKKLILE